MVVEEKYNELKEQSVEPFSKADEEENLNLSVSLTPEKFESSTERLMTFHFKKYNGKISALSCAESGLVCKSKSVLACPWCKLEVDVHCIDDIDILSYHRLNSSQCEFLIKNINTLRISSGK